MVGPAQPVALAALLSAKAGGEQPPVRFRPASWEAVIGAEACSLLRDDAVTTASSRVAGDRVIDGAVLRAVAAATALDNSATLRALFVLIMAWGSGTSNPRSYRYTASAMVDPRLDAALRDTASMCRDDDESNLEAAYARWKVNGVGRSFFTKWFTFAGHVEGRTWQPLILDDRVLRTLNNTLHVTTVELAGTKRWAARYRCYVEALHAWGEGPEGAARIERVLFAHGREN